MNNIKRTFGLNLKKARKSKFLSQEMLAEKTNLHRTYIGSVERGERNISLENIVILARALDVSLSTLLEGI